MRRILLVLSVAAVMAAMVVAMAVPAFAKDPGIVFIPEKACEKSDPPDGKSPGPKPQVGACGISTKP